MDMKYQLDSVSYIKKKKKKDMNVKVLGVSDGGGWESK